MIVPSQYRRWRRLHFVKKCGTPADIVVAYLHTIIIFDQAHVAMLSTACCINWWNMTVPPLYGVISKMVACFVSQSPWTPFICTKKKIKCSRIHPCGTPQFRIFPLILLIVLFLEHIMTYSHSRSHTSFL